MSNREAVYRARKPYFFQGPPPNSSGQEGDFAISKDIKGLSLYVKYLKKWQRVSGLESQAQKGEGKYIGAEKKTFKSLETDEVVSKKNIKARNIVSSYKHRETKDSTTRGVDVDVTQLNATASGQEVSSIGIDVDVDTSTPTNIGMTNTTGLDVYAKGSAAGGSNTYGMTVKADGADNNTGIYMNIADGGRDIRMVSSADTGDYCTIATGTNGATTIATIDDDAAAANFTLDIDGDIILDSDNGSVDIKDSGSTRYAFDNDRFRMFNSALFGNYIEITSQGPGKTIATNDVSAAAAHLTINPDGDIILQPQYRYVKIEDSVLMVEERASAQTSVANYGQIWVKNEAPNELYFTTDAGDDIQITDGTSLAGGGGGTNNHILTFTARANTRYDNWYFPSITYGPYYYSWTSSQNSSSLPSTWYDNYNPNLVVPVAMTLKSYHFYFNCPSHTENLEFATLKGTGVTYGSAGNYTMSNVGATQAVTIGTSDILYKAEQTGLSVSFAAGDIVMPTLRRTTTDTSAFKYVEISWSAVFEVD